MTDPTACENRIDLDALAANHAALVGEARGAEVAPVVKADAYALGAAPVALRLWAEGARTFFVARVAEGESLRTILAGRPAAIYVLDGCPAGSVARLEAAALTPVLNSPDQVDLWRTEGRRPAALHIDTGMNRLGVRPEEAEAIGRRADLAIEMVMSHLACGSNRDHPMNAVQAARFGEVRALFPDARASLASSAGIFSGEAFRFDIVRPGVSLYGGGPFEQTHAAIAPVSTVTAPVLQVRDVPAGETVGYGATWTAERSTRVAILAAGFADGVLRAASPGGYGWLAGRPRPYLGRVSMDLIAIDVTGPDPVRPGDRVELLGPNVRLDDLARLARTVPYEILTRPAGRIVRRYRGEAA